MEETPEQIAGRPEEQKAWQQIIGEKIICSECNNRDLECFNFIFSLTKRGPKSFVHVRCTLCNHEGDYNPTNEEVYQYEFIVKANIDKQILELHGDNPPITNVEVESEYRKGRIETNYALEA